MLSDPYSNPDAAGPASLAAAVIAGGKSSRFGSSKALAELEGRRLIEHALALAAAIAPRVILNYGALNPWPEAPVPAVADSYPGCGPMGGILAVLAAAPATYIATLPCDMPLLTPEIYQALFRLRAPERPVVARSHRGLEPLVAIWPATLAQPLQEALEARQYALQRFLKSINALEVPLLEIITDYQPNWFANINRPEDLEEVRRVLKDEG